MTDTHALSRARPVRRGTGQHRTDRRTDKDEHLEITITRPTAQHRIITDMQTLAESVRLGNRILELDATADATESEASERRREQDAVRKQLDSLLKIVEHKTLVVTFRGLNSSQWAQITLKKLQDRAGACDQGPSCHRQGGRTAHARIRRMGRRR